MTYLELASQLMNFKFVLSAIIWGDRETNFVGSSVDLNRENYIFDDGMASPQMVIFHHQESLSSLALATFGGLLQLWYVKKPEK